MFLITINSDCHKKDIVALAFSRRHRVAVTGDSEGNILTWDGVLGQHKKYLSTEQDQTCTDPNNPDRAVEKVL